MPESKFVPGKLGFLHPKLPRNNRPRAEFKMKGGTVWAARASKMEDVPLSDGVKKDIERVSYLVRRPIWEREDVWVACSAAAALAFLTLRLDQDPYIWVLNWM